HGIAQVIPRHGLGLFEERREIGKPRVLLRGFDRAALELMNAGNRLAGAAMGDEAGEALLAPMKRAELRARAIIEILASHSCLHWSSRCCRGPVTLQTTGQEQGALQTTGEEQAPCKR